MRKSAIGIPDYNATAGAVLTALTHVAGKQVGDPARAAKAIYSIVAAENPPLHLVLGKDALSRTRRTQEHLSTDLTTWEQVTTATEFAEEAPS